MLEDRFIFHTIVNINPQIILDPVLVTCMQRIFDWANQQGLQGKKVDGLQFIESTTNAMSDPFNQMIKARCRIHVNEKEFELVKENYKNKWKSYCEDLGISSEGIEKIIDEKANNA